MTSIQDKVTFAITGFNHRDTTRQSSTTVQQKQRKWLRGLKMTNERKCKYCGEIFTPKAKQQRYCSPECSKVAARIREREHYERKKQGIKAQKTLTGEGYKVIVNKKIEDYHRESHLDEAITEAKRLGMSYGMYKAMKWRGQ